MIHDVLPVSGRAKHTMQTDITKQPSPTPIAADSAPIVVPDTTSEPTEVFQTPEQTAAVEDLQPIAPVSTGAEPASRSNNLNRLKSFFSFSWPPQRKEYIAGALAVVAVLLISGTVFALTRSDPAPVVKKPVFAKKVAPPPAPKTVASTLSGLQVDPAINARPVTAMMVENSLDARPQSGLSEAGVVFEAIAEGGVTRFMAVFQDKTPDNVGPIRSARPYYVAWAQGFDAGYAHVGGSPQGLQDIKDWGIKDLDQFFNSGSYHRIDTRSAPHNVYTGVQTLIDLQNSKGYTKSTFTGFTRKVAAPLAAPTAKTLDFSLSGPYYNPHFDYVPATNTYNRTEYSQPHTDQNSGQQLSPNVVVAMVTPLGQGELDSSGAYYSEYTVIGSGAAYIFQDGGVTTGQWTKASNTAQIVFTDAAGKPIGLNPGQTWITAVSSESGVGYTP